VVRFGVFDPGDGVFSAEPPIICLAADNQMHASWLSLSLSPFASHNKRTYTLTLSVVNGAKVQIWVYGLLMFMCSR
jgi:hypothetical protein